MSQQSAPPPSAYPPVAGVQITQAEFGVFRDLSSPGATLDPVRTVQRDQRPIGWVIALDTQKSKVRWREEFTVPTPPKKWGLTPDLSDVRPTAISGDRMTASTERLVPVGGGTISHWWKLDASDPAGPHTMRVYVEDVLVGDFKFDVN
ncbi:hypothetical protein BH11PSE13_BH11PSE13_16580 [soil metagenome]